MVLQDVSKTLTFILTCQSVIFHVSLSTIRNYEIVPSNFEADTSELLENISSILYG